MAVEIDSIEIKITESTSGAEKKINDLIGSLNNLKQALGGISGRGLKGFVSQINELNNSASDTSGAAKNISRLATAFRGLEGVSNIRLNKNLSAQIGSLADACNAFTDDVIDRTHRMAAALQNLNGLDLRGLKIPSNVLQASAPRTNAAAAGTTPIVNIAEIESVEQTADRVTDATEDMGDASDDAEKKVSRLSAAFSRLKESIATKQLRAGAKAADEHASKLSKLATAFKRIMVYRALRSLIREITQAFSEGLQQAYLFSQGITTEGHRFSAAMDSMKSAVTQMKGQLGSAFIGLLTALQPIIEKIVSLVTKLADIISQFFAAFTGGTYLKAIRTQASFADTTARGAKAAKEWKNQLLGFDEINKLNEAADTARVSGIDLADGYEFEDTAISQKIKNFVDKIKEKFKQLKDSIDFTKLKESLGIAGNSFSGLWEKIKSGFGWVWDNILVPLAKWTIEDAAPIAVDFLAAAFDLLKEALVVLKPVFEVIGNLILTILPEITDLIRDFVSLLRGDMSFGEFIGGMSGVQKVLLGIGAVAIIHGMTSLGASVVALASTFTAQATIIGGAVLSILSSINQLMEAHNGYQEAAHAHENETNTALLNYKKLYKERGKEIADEWAAMVYSIDLSGADFEQAQQLLTYKIDGLWADVPENMWDGFAQGWDHYFGDDGVGIGQYMGDAFGGAIDGIKDLLGIHSPSTVFEEIGKNTVLGLEDGFNNSWSDFLTTMRQKVDSLKNWWQNINLGSFSVQTPKIKAAGAYGGAIASRTISMYATGGIPRSGELFIARERGPELVGTIGSNTAVANNDQIESGIEEAAYRGFVRAMVATGDNRNSGGDVVLNINGREFARATYNDYRAAARENGGSLIKNFA